MSERNIYQDHYELQVAFGQAQESLHNLYASLHPLVAPHGVQLSLQEVLELTVQKLERFNAGEAAAETPEEEIAEEQSEVISQTHDVHILPNAKKSRKSK